MSRLCESAEEARRVKGELRRELMGEAAEQAAAGEAPATLALLCDAYILDLEARGKAADSIIRARDTRNRLEEFFGKRM